MAKARRRRGRGRRRATDPGPEPPPHEGAAVALAYCPEAGGSPDDGGATPPCAVQQLLERLLPLQEGAQRQGRRVHVQVRQELNSETSGRTKPVRPFLISCMFCFAQRRPGVLQRGVPVAADPGGRGARARGGGGDEQQGAAAASAGPPPQPPPHAHAHPWQAAEEDTCRSLASRSSVC